MARIVIIAGSPTAQSRTGALARQVAVRLAAQGMDASVLDVRELPAEDLLHARCESPAIRAALEAVERADGVVLVTPIYKAAYSGLLKAFLDLLPQAGLRGKAVVPLAVGGSMAHLLAIDYALRPVLTSMAARHVTAGLFLLESLVQRTATGEVVLAPELADRLALLLDELADCLRAAPPSTAELAA